MTNDKMMVVETTAIEENTYKAVPLKYIKDHQEALSEMMRSILREEVDFGVIPGTPKRSLWKPGAEKVLKRFNVHVGAPVVENMSQGDKIHYRVMLPGVTPDGVCRGWGIGECSSFETKYRWRRALCQEEYDEFPPMQRRKHWRWDKRDNKPVCDQQVQQDGENQVNTILKMAKKRALVDLCLTATAASDFFTQDEDLNMPTSSGVRRTRPKAGPKTETYVGRLKDISQKAGKTGDKEWVKYGIKLEDDRWVNTLSKSLGERAREILDSPDQLRVKIEYVQDKYGLKMETLELASD